MEHQQEHVLIEYEKGSHEKKQNPNLPAWIIAGGMLVSTLIVSSAIILGLYSLAGAVNRNSQQLAVGQMVPSAPGAVPNNPGATGPVDVKGRSDEPYIGNKNAKVTVVEFADFQCPYCKQFHQTTYSQLKKDYIDTGKIKYVFRHLPLTQIHANAQIASQGAECASQQGKFWEYHDILFTSGQSDGTGLDKDSLKKYADNLGLNKGTLGFGSNKFNQCLDNNSTKKVVDEDAAEGARVGVTGTPTFYINGTQLVGAQPYAVFQAKIEEALKK